MNEKKDVCTPPGDWKTDLVANVLGSVAAVVITGAIGETINWLFSDRNTSALSPQERRTIAEEIMKNQTEEAAAKETSQLPPKRRGSK